MAGTVYGKFDCFSNPGFGTSSENYLPQEMFKGLYDFMVYLETQGVVTIRARWGGGGASATSTDYWDGADPFRSNAWFLVEWRTASTTPSNPSYAGTRTYPWYMLIQFHRSDQSTFGAAGSGGNPGLFLTSVGSNVGALAYASAIGVGGDMNPWNGTLGTYGNPASFGSQTKGDPVWKVPTGGTDVYVLPRSNNLGGTHNTSKQNMNQMAYFDSLTTARYSFIADHDSFLSVVDEGTTGNWRIHYNGLYTPRSGLTAPYPMIQLSTDIPIPTSVFGNTTGAGYPNGGFISQGVYTGSRPFTISRLSEVFTVQPNTMYGTPTYDEMPINFGLNDNLLGYAGDIEFFREVHNIASQDTNTGGTKAIFGTTTVASIKCIIPWKSTVVPGSGTTREGTTTSLP